MKNGILLVVGAIVFLAGEARAGGGGVGVHYLCGSRQLNLSFQLDNRPESRYFPIGTPVLVRESSIEPRFYHVTDFVETSESVRLAMKSPDRGFPSDFEVTWLTDSIVDHISIVYNHGKHRDTAVDGKCTPLN